MESIVIDMYKARTGIICEKVWYQFKNNKVVQNEFGEFLAPVVGDKMGSIFALSGEFLAPCVGDKMGSIFA